MGIYSHTHRRVFSAVGVSGWCYCLWFFVLLLGGELFGEEGDEALH